MCVFCDISCVILRPYLRDRYRKQKTNTIKYIETKGDYKNEKFLKYERTQ